MKQLISILIVVSALTACSMKTLYTQSYDMPSEQWHKDSVQTFSTLLYESDDLHDVFVTIRHTPSYPYQNLWLFVNRPDGQCDTLEFFLADDRGVWLGNRAGRYIEMPCLIEQGVRFSAEGRYTWQVRQGMREDQLRGISSVGLTIEKQ